MIANRDLGFDDYVEMVQRRLKVILVPALIVALCGFAVSFLFSPKYMSSALITVERQTVPAGYVKPIVTAAISDRILSIEQEVLSHRRLELMVNDFALTRIGKTADEAVDQIQNNVLITETNPSNPNASVLRRGTYVPGFYVSYSARNPQDAQQVCSAITSMLLEENLKAREQVTVNTTDFLSRQLEEAKTNLDSHDKDLAAFKSRYLGQLPGDVDNNLKIVMGLETQLDAYTQNLNRAQQDKSYTESVLAQQLAAWKSSQTAMTSDTIGQQLAGLQAQLVALQARYTEDHPEVIKMKNDIAAMRAKQKEMQSALAHNTVGDEVEGKNEPSAIRQLRLQIHQDEIQIARATAEQSRIQKQIATYQGRLTLSPTVEEQYKQLTRDNETAHQIYNNLLINKNESEVQTDLERRQQGEQWHLLEPASLPGSPVSPIRWKFAALGLAAGLGLGIVIAAWLELRDKTIRNEADVLASLELPTLSSIPRLDFAPAVAPGARFKVISDHID